jgi:hypothetical protein
MFRWVQEQFTGIVGSKAKNFYQLTVALVNPGAVVFAEARTSIPENPKNSRSFANSTAKNERGPQNRLRSPPRSL